MGIEEAGLHIVLKKIIKSDKERLQQDSSSETFGHLLIQELTEETLLKWITINRACFVLLNIVENNNEEIVKQIKALLQPHTSILKKQKFNGSQLLQKKLF